MERLHLVNPKHLEEFAAKTKVVNLPRRKINYNFYFNITILVLFILFSIYFLYKCKYTKIEEQPLPYSMIYNFH